MNECEQCPRTCEMLCSISQRACWVDDMRGEVIDAPAADVAPVVHGLWEAKGYVCGESEFECSVCHKTEWRTSISRFRWCPFCGARMDGDDDG